MAKRKANSGTIPPDGELRSSQLLTTYGPGSLVDLVNHSVLISGLDDWRWGWGQPRVAINEPRLRAQIESKFKDSGLQLNKEAPFVLPPAGDNQNPNRYHGINARLFPEWFVCSKCRALVKRDLLTLQGGRYMHECSRKKHDCVPMRFVGACPRGHIQDYDWMWFVHQGDPCSSPRLEFIEGASGDFASMYVHCKGCKARRQLIDAKLPESSPRCRGMRPWLGWGTPWEECPNKIKLMVRTASNSYFSQTTSALSLGEQGPDLHETVRGLWKYLQNATREMLPMLRQIMDEVREGLMDFSDGEVARAIFEIKTGVEAEPEPLRQTEYARFMEQPLEEYGDKPRAEDVFFARRSRTEPPEGIEAVILAHKLREVRVQVGFTRLEPATPNFEGELDIGVRTAPLSLHEDWLPAIEVLGEGIFLKLDEEMLRQWEARPVVQQREQVLREAFEEYYMSRYKQLDQEESSQPPAFPGIRFYLLHSLSHLLITALSLDCGYSASAIRERIYCAGADSDFPMSGILLSTGTPGSEGTLGGLVEQGRRLELHLRRALMLGALCSHDPVCASHDPKEDKTDRNLDGAACHGCLYIAECSCEWFNRHLDRALVVPCIGHDPYLAFFKAV